MTLGDGRTIAYGQLCVCSGGTPKVGPSESCRGGGARGPVSLKRVLSSLPYVVRQRQTILDHPDVLGLRDTETVEVYRRRLAGARRVMVVGNGGIALEIVYVRAPLECRPMLAPPQNRTSHGTRTCLPHHGCERW